VVKLVTPQHLVDQVVEEKLLAVELLVLLVMLEVILLLKEILEVLV
jgi:hypothetical protein